jgi:hypothetical protein
MSRRAVIVDPAGSGDVGHHAEVNDALRQVLGASEWQVEVWDGSVLEGCGYLDPRHWADLGGTLHLARRCEQQLELAVGSGAHDVAPVGAWMVHTALPFQLLGLARLLRRQPAASVLVSLMFPPGETLEGATADPQAESHARVALAALAEAARQQQHRLEIWCPSRQTLSLYEPLLRAAGLEAAGIHRAVVGAGVPVEADRVAGGPGVLLHWGDLKQGKGRGEALQVVQELLEGRSPPAALQGARWLFQVHSRDPLPAGEQRLLERAARELPRFSWINGRVPTEEMQQLLAGCTRALLAYDPQSYGQRSSGLLWCYGAARLAIGAEAVAVGHGQGWLAREAAELGIGWHECRGDWLEALGSSEASAKFTARGREVLGGAFAAQVAERLQAMAPIADQGAGIRLL